MEANELFKADSRTIAQLFLNNGQFFYIPAYQRQYNWSKNVVRKLVEDVVHAIHALTSDDDSYAFLGTIIIIKDVKHDAIAPIHKPDLPQGVYLVIDGQQRMTTLVLLLVALHYRLRQQYDKIKKIAIADRTETEEYVYQQSSQDLTQINKMLIELQFVPGAKHAPYVRIIRAYKDGWSKSESLRKYTSPLSNLIHEYLMTADAYDLNTDVKSFEPKEFPKGGEETAVKERYKELHSHLRGLTSIKGIGDEQICLPLASAALNSNFKSVFFPTITDSILADLQVIDSKSELSDSFRLLMLTKFILNRVAITVVEVKKEQYAFSVFDALNTSGQPLAPFETFRPLVMSAVGIASYRNSDEDKLMTAIANDLGNLDDENNRKGATNVLISFALAECGYKLSKDISVQRTFFRNSFGVVAHNPQERIEYIKLLGTVVKLKKCIWANWRLPKLPNDSKYVVSSELRVCLGYLAKLDHTIVLPILAKFWLRVEDSADEATRKHTFTQFEKIVKAICAFTTLYRGISGTTDGIDDEYRNVISGIDSPNSRLSLQRSNLNFYRQDVDLEDDLDAESFCKDLGQRITRNTHRAITDRSEFISKAKNINIYKSGRDVARFMLFAANDDCLGDKGSPGLLTKGAIGLHSVLDVKYWGAETSNSVEHIAPQTKPDSGWDDNIYSNQNAVHYIGNLTLCPPSINAVLGNAPWIRKRQVYRALGLQLPIAEIKKELNKANPPFTNLIDVLDKDQLEHCPFFSNIGSKTDDWDADFINARSENILGLVWDRLAPWLEIP
jgi:hypothetical protein